MCLSVIIEHPEHLLNKGEHLGHEWAVTHNGGGYRCGYIKLEPGHPWYGKDYIDIAADAHGGITFSEADVPCGKGGPDNGWWVGFDCAHIYDKPDPELRQLYHPPLLLRTGSVRTQEYVEAVCFSLCQQAAEAVQPLGSRLMHGASAECPSIKG